MIKRDLVIFLNINLLTTISMNSSRRELSIDIVILKGIFENHQMTLFGVLSSYLKQWLVFTVRFAIKSRI